MPTSQREWVQCALPAWLGCGRLRSKGDGVRLARNLRTRQGLATFVKAGRATRSARTASRLLWEQERYQRHPELIGHMLHVR